MKPAFFDQKGLFKSPIGGISPPYGAVDSSMGNLKGGSMVSLYKMEKGQLVFIDRGTPEKTEEYGRQGYICVFDEPTIIKTEVQKEAA